MKMEVGQGGSLCWAVQTVQGVLWGECAVCVAHIATNNIPECQQNERLTILSLSFSVYLMTNNPLTNHKKMYLWTNSGSKRLAQNSVTELTKKFIRFNKISYILSDHYKSLKKLVGTIFKKSSNNCKYVN